MRDKFESTPNKRARVAFYVSVLEESKNSSLFSLSSFAAFHPEGEGKNCPSRGTCVDPMWIPRGRERGSSEKKPWIKAEEIRR